MTPSADASGVRFVGHNDLAGHGDGMHVNVHRGYAYVGHMGNDRTGTSILDVRDPRNPTLVHQLQVPVGTRSHKVQVVDDLLLVNYEKNPAEVGTVDSWQGGLKIYDISEPTNPVEVSFYPMAGKGVHRMTYFEAPYAWLAGSDNGYLDQFLVVMDLSDPAHPVEVARWAPPGIREGEGDLAGPGRRIAAHHFVPRGNRLYGTWWDGGFSIHDISDPRNPSLISHVQLPPEISGATHTPFPLPGRDVLLVGEEATDNGVQRHVRVFDISDERNPVLLSQLPVPEGTFRTDNARFGPHNLHEMRPGSYQSSNRVHLTYFSGGLRIFDLTDAASPVEVGHYLPTVGADEDAIQFNDVTVTAEGLIYVTDRRSRGLYILEDLNA